MEFSNVVHVGIVVRNIERARALWAKLLDLEPQQVVETEGWEKTHMTFKGKPSDGRAKLTFFKLENIVIELIQPIGGSSSWKDFLDKHDEGIHHIAFMIENPEGAAQRLLAVGANEEQRGFFEGGGYIYFDARGSLGAILELLYHEK